MSSFYGGKQGRTYNIVKRYDSVRQMVQAFANGGAYTEVNYGQYVLIDTILNNNHKSDLENGLLFRRGFDYNDPYSTIYVPKKEDKDSQGNYLYKDVNGNLDKDKWQSAWMTYVTHVGAGAIYVGQIVGPQGDSPQITPVKWDDIKDEASVKIIIPVSTTKGNEVTPSSTIQTPSGTVYKGDTIKIASLTVKDGDDDGNVIGAKIAFDIPTTIHEPGIIDTDPYKEASFIENPASTAHPFWYKWDFGIPGGKNGQDIETIDIQTGQQTKEENDGFGNPIVNEDEYFTYSIRNYKDSADGALTEHLGRWPYRVIDNITLINKDRVIINWQDNYQAQIGDLYRNDNYLSNYYWVCVQSGTISASDVLNDIIINEETGEPSYPLGFQDKSRGGIWRVVTIPQKAPAHSLIVDYKAGENDQFINQLRNLDYLAVDKKGDVYAFYSNQTQPYYLTNIGGLESVALDNMGIVFTYKDTNTVSYPLKQILSIDFKQGTPLKNPDPNKKEEWWIVDGKPVFDYTIDENNQKIPKPFDEIPENSFLKIRYKDGTTEPQFEVKRINKIIYNNDNIEDTQNITVEYLGGESKPVNQEPINLVTAVDRQGDNLIILYTDPGVRNTIPINKQVMKNWTDPVSGTEYSNLIWYNFGPLGAQYHTQGMYTYNDLKPGGDLENGFTGDLEDRMGWLITIQDNQGNLHIYAYDYNDSQTPSHTIGNTGDTFSSHWYEIMSLDAASINPKRSVQIANSINNIENVDTLQDGMLWFVSSVGHDNYQDNIKNINSGG